MFKIGDQVEWTSQSQGYTKTKRGVVAQVVPAEQRPDKTRFPQLFRGIGCGYGRNHESYVVLVGKRPYWPVASRLTAVKQ